MNESERRRRRPAISCITCRRRKIKCDREAPCSNCLKSGNSECTYDPHVVQQARSRSSRPVKDGSIPHQRSPSTSRQSVTQSQSSGVLPSGLSSASTVADHSSTWDVESLKDRVRQLEGQLSQAGQLPDRPPITVTTPSIEASTSSIGGTWYMHRQGGPRRHVSSITHKTRQFGQSHWVNAVSLFTEVMIMIEPLLKTEMCPVIPNLQRCKALARTIKHQRKPAWPSVINSELPSKHISDQLVDGYLRTIETVYRVLHIPTFKRDYEALWTSGDKPDQAFLVLVKLVLAIGAAVYDENFSLKAAATQWVFEAQTWIAEPNVKKHLHLQGLQIHIILLFAREIDDVAGDSVYMSAGDLYRRAVIMGLHRDPTQLPQKSVYVTEMRRRMWSTILEVCLQSSLMTGAPPLLSLNDFDTQPPSNLDDDQLGLEAPAPKSETRFTQVSVALALRKTFPVRLSIIKSLNDLHRINSYEETLQLDTELRDCYRAVSRVLQTFKSDSDLDFSQFGLQMVDLLMQRYIAALHIPFFGSSLDQSAFAFSRKVTIEASLRIWYIVRPLSTTMAGRTERDSDTLAAQDISRLAVSGAGLFRNAATQSALLIAVELKAQLQDDDSLGPTPVRPDLIAVLRDSVDWGLHCIKNGETNIKGYLMSRLIIAQIEAIIRGVHRDEMARIMVNATIDAENVCLPILEEMADDTNSDEVALDAQKTAFSSPSDVDWDLMMTDSLFDVGSAETMGWMLGSDPTQGGTLW